MQVTATQFKVNLGQYLEMVRHEDVVITKNGKIVAKLINPNTSAVDALSGVLSGKISDDLDGRALRAERLKKYESDD